MIITQEELRKFRIDLFTLDNAKFLNFKYSLTEYEQKVLEFFMVDYSPSVCCSILLIRKQFYDFIKER